MLWIKTVLGGETRLPLGGASGKYSPPVLP